MQIYLMCMDKKSIVKSDATRAYEEMLVQLDPDFGNTFSHHSELEQGILIALATGKTSISTISREIMKPQSTIPKTMNRLMTLDLVEKYYNARYRIADGIFSDWIRKQVDINDAQGFKMSIS